MGLSRWQLAAWTVLHMCAGAGSQSRWKERKPDWNVPPPNFTPSPQKVKCVRVVWPSLLEERTEHMYNFSRWIGGCEPIVVKATRKTDLTVVRTGLGRGQVFERGRPWTGTHFKLGQDEPRANTANAITQMRMWRAVVEADFIPDHEWVLFLEDDATMHPKAERWPSSLIASVILFAFETAADLGFAMTHFGLCNTCNSYKMKLRCNHVSAPEQIVREWHLNDTGAPGMNTMRGKATCATAYGMSKARARVLLDAWDALGRDSFDCPAGLFGDPFCPHDPIKMFRYLGQCNGTSTRSPDSGRCHSLLVGAYWHLLKGYSYQSGFIIQDTRRYGSTISAARAKENSQGLIAVPSQRRALRAQRQRKGKDGAWEAALEAFGVGWRGPRHRT